MANAPHRKREVSVSPETVKLGEWARVPETFTYHLSDAPDGSPNVEITWQVVNGSPVCREVRISAIDNEHEVKASGIVGVRVEDLLEDASRALVVSGDARHGGPRMLASERAQLAAVREVRTVRAARKVKITDDLLRDVARIYRENMEGQPTAAVAEHFDRRHRTAALYVKHARERIDPDTGVPFLGKAIKGKAGEQ